MTKAPILRRAVGFADVEVTGRTVYGVLVPYGTTAEVSDGGPSYREQFAPGAFARSARERGDRTPLFHSHDSGRVLGRSIELRDQPHGLEGSFALSKTRDSDDALELIKDGALAAFSVGFRPIRKHTRDGVTVRSEAALREVSLTAVPAYAGAGIEGVRSLDLYDHTRRLRRIQLLARGVHIQ